MNNILLTIAARGGSKGVKNKNIRELCGMPLIAHTILQAQQWGKASKIICSTDSHEIAEIAKHYGALVPFVRPSELAQDTTGKIDVLRHAVKTIEQLDKRQYETIVDLDVTAPIRKISDIDNAVQLFLTKRPDSVVSVTPAHRNPYFNMLEVKKDGFVDLVKKLDFPVKRRQDAPVVYDMNASIYVYDRKFLLSEETKTAISHRSLVWVMEEWSAFDIDSEHDFQFIEFLLSKELVTL